VLELLQDLSDLEENGDLIKIHWNEKHILLKHLIFKLIYLNLFSYFEFLSVNINDFFF